MTTVVDTSSVATATAYSNQRKIDRCQNGVLWSVHYDGAGTWEFLYSTDNGATWTASGTNVAEGATDNYIPNASLFIDVDDYAHFVTRNREDGRNFYRRGAPNAGRTAWTWSAALEITGIDYNYPDIVAHREGTGWRAHVVTSWADNTTNDGAYYTRINITSAGDISIGVSLTTIGRPYGNTNHKWVSIDFNHTGDGKTIAGGTPHLYAVWSAGNSGSGKGIRFKKATYSSGSWTWGTEREIDSDTYVFNDKGWLNCLFDGTRVIMPGTLYSAANGHSRQMLYERDAADTTTTKRDVKGSAVTSTDPTWRGSASYDDGGNVFFAGLTINTTTKKVGYRRWERASATLETEVYLADCEQNYLSAKRGYSENYIELLFTDGSASPYNVLYDAISLNKPPNKPPIVAPKNNNTVDRNKTVIFDWEFSDPDSGDSQSKFELNYRVVGTSTWSRVVESTSNTYHALSPGTLSANDYEWQVRTYDQAGEVSVWSDTAYFTAANAPSGHSITDPLVNQTINTEQYTVEWSASGQREYELRRVADDGSGAPDTNNVLYTTGIVTSGTTRSRTLEFPTNNQTEHIQLRYSDDTGLWSTWDSVSVAISYTTPPSPIVTAVGNDLNGYIAVAIDNPTPAAGEPSVVSNDLFRREEGNKVVKIAEGLVVDGTFNDYRVENRKNYEYQAQAIGDNGTTALSAWAG